MDARLIVVFVAIVLFASATSALALSLTPLDSSRTRTRSSTGTINSSSSSTALDYMTGLNTYHDILDVDGDRTSLRTLLDPPAAPRETLPPPEPEATAPSRTSSSSSRTSQRTSSITVLHSIQDYQRHVLHVPNRLCIVRFSAPYCKACRLTNVSWERMAAKIHKLAAGGTTRIKFLAVSVDGKDEATAALKDMLRVDRVPQGILHYPARGLFGQKVDLDRANLAALRKRLEAHVEGEGAEGGVLFDVPEFRL